MAIDLTTAAKQMGMTDDEAMASQDASVRAEHGLRVRHLRARNALEHAMKALGARLRIDAEEMGDGSTMPPGDPMRGTDAQNVSDLRIEVEVLASAIRLVVHVRQEVG